MVVQEALELRLAHVERMLPRAAHHHQEDVEHVHRLRVGCRRASAALSAFRPLIPDKVKPLKRWLRELRRAAGPARDLDVFLIYVRHVISPDQPQLKEAIRNFEQQRRKAQRRLVAIASKAQKGGLRKAIDKCLANIPKSGDVEDAPFGRFAKSVLAEVAGDMFRLAALGKTGVDQLHELRIAVKRLRYSIELFHSVFPRSLRYEFYPKMEELQMRLGLLNDHQTAQLQFQRLLADLPPDDLAANLARAIVREHQATQDARDVFLQWWSKERIESMRTEIHQQLDQG